MGLNGILGNAFRFLLLIILGFALDVAGSKAQPAAADAPTSITVAQDGAGNFRGRVVDANTGLPIARFTVNLRGQLKLARTDLKLPDVALEHEFRAPDGRFAFNGTGRPQLFRMLFRSPGYAPYFIDSYTIADPRKPELTVALAPPRPLAVKLIDKASGQPIAGGKLAAGYFLRRPGRNWEAIVAEAQDPTVDAQFLESGVDGAAVISEGERSTTRTLLIQAPGYGIASFYPFERPSGAGGNLVIPLGRIASISGRVLVDGRVPSGQWMHLRQDLIDGGGPALERNAAIDAEGRYAFDDLQPSTYTLSVEARLRGLYCSVFSQRTPLAGGEALTLDFGLKPGPSALFGTVRYAGAPAPDRDVRLVRFNQLGDLPLALDRSTVSGDKGEFQFLGLEPGQYRILISANWSNIGAGFNTRFLEDFTVGAEPTQRDFDVKPGKLVVARLVFPPDFPPDLRTGLRSATLLRSQRPPQTEDTPASSRLETSMSSPVVDERIIFAGRIQGDYRLRLIFLPPRAAMRQQRGPSLIRLSVETPLKIDNLQNDIDLGDINVPLPEPPQGAAVP